MVKIKNVGTIAAATAMAATAVVPMAAFAVDPDVADTIDAGIGQVKAGAPDTAQLAVAKNFNADPMQPASFTFHMEKVSAIDDNGQAKAVADMPAPAADVTISYTGSDTTSKSATFGDMQFTAPGYYMYKVTETAGNTNGVQYDDTDYFVVIYVVNNTDASGNTVSGVHIKDITSWHNEDGESTNAPAIGDLTVTQDSASAAQVNSDGVVLGKVDDTRFVNELPSADLDITKNVTGNLGHLTQLFPVTVTLTGLTPGATYAVTGDQTATPVTSIVASADGTATQVLNVKDDSHIKIADLPMGATYVVSEAASDHVASLTISGDGTQPVIATTGGAVTNTAMNTACATAQEIVQEADGNVTVAYTNNRTFRNVTGVPFMAIPFGIAALAGGAGALISRKRKSNINL